MNYVFVLAVCTAITHNYPPRIYRSIWKLSQCLSANGSSFIYWEKETIQSSHLSSAGKAVVSYRVFHPPDNVRLHACCCVLEFLLGIITHIIQLWYFANMSSVATHGIEIQSYLFSLRKCCQIEIVCNMMDLADNKNSSWNWSMLIYFLGLFPYSVLSANMSSVAAHEPKQRAPG